MTKRMGPGDVPRNERPVVTAEPTEEEWAEAMKNQRLMAVPSQDDLDAHEAIIVQKLALLREPFPPELIEHLPKQKWKKSWEDQRYENCDECGGYHPLGHRTIHLDYVGHAGVTSRLLEVDPFWEWEPLQWDQNGLPKYDGFGGLWIKLTICGVTRLGYGDAVGKSAGTTAVKEIIGDAIRNAAMRFGVALDLWSKADQHANKNPGAIDEGQAQQRRSARDGAAADDRSGSHRGRGAAGVGDGDSHSATPARSANQDALDELLDVCSKNGLDARYVEDRYNKQYAPPELVKADPDDIRNYASILIAECDNGPDDAAPAEAGPEVGAGGESSDDGGRSVGEVAPAESDAAVGDEAQADPANMF